MWEKLCFQKNVSTQAKPVAPPPVKLKENICAAFICTWLSLPISVYFLNHIRHGRNGANSILLCNRNRSCDEHQASNQINSHFVRKRRTGRRSNGGMSHFVYVKPNQTTYLCFVWKFVYVVFDNLSILCMTICLCCVWHILIALFCLYCIWN